MLGVFTMDLAHVMNVTTMLALGATAMLLFLGFLSRRRSSAFINVRRCFVVCPIAFHWVFRRMNHATLLVFSTWVLVVNAMDVNALVFVMRFVTLHGLLLTLV